MTSLRAGPTPPNNLGSCRWCRALGHAGVKPVAVIVTGTLSCMSVEAYAYCAEHTQRITEAFEKDQLFMRPEWSKVDEILVSDL